MTDVSMLKILLCGHNTKLYKTLPFLSSKDIVCKVVQSISCVKSECHRMKETEVKEGKRGQRYLCSGAASLRLCHPASEYILCQDFQR